MILFLYSFKRGRFLGGTAIPAKTLPQLRHWITYQLYYQYIRIIQENRRQYKKTKANRRATKTEIREEEKEKYVEEVLEKDAE